MLIILWAAIMLDLVYLLYKLVLRKNKPSITFHLLLPYFFVGVLILAVADIKPSFWAAHAVLSLVLVAGCVVGELCIQRGKVARK